MSNACYVVMSTSWSVRPSSFEGLSLMYIFQALLGGVPLAAHCNSFSNVSGPSYQRILHQKVRRPWIDNCSRNNNNKITQPQRRAGGRGGAASEACAPTAAPPQPPPISIYLSFFLARTNRGRERGREGAGNGKMDFTQPKAGRGF